MAKPARPAVARTKAASPRAPATAAPPTKARSARKPEAIVQGVFPIVGIGCSAGGLEALERFLSGVPAGSGLAFVVVQHLDPTRASNLPELLQRATAMPVVEARDRLAVKPDRVYLIPPNKDLSILHGALHLLEPAGPRGLRHSIDFFLRTLADDRLDNAVGILLSGMGSDGVLGLRAIKEKGGLTLAQEPTSAKADSMPKSAIEAGLVDIVAMPEDLAARIVSYLQHVPRTSESSALWETRAPSALEQIVILLRDRCGNDFSLYKTSSLYRRIERRTALHQIDKITTYVRYLRENPQEIDLLFKELLIGVTSFFRDPAVWEYLRRDAIPALFTLYPAGRALRAWVPACSSGEEAYSLAIVFKEALAFAKPSGRFTLQIYATDLDTDAVEKARKGIYPKNIAADVSPERLARYFVAENDGESYLIRKEIREMIVFARQNIISDPPFTKLDILTCRNLLIYFGAPLQKKLLPLFHYALNRNGILLLGSAESIGTFTDLFAPTEKKMRVFRRLDHSGLPPSNLSFPTGVPEGAPAAVPAAPAAPAESLGDLTDQLIQQTYAPAAVLVNADGDILYISGRTGKYLEPAAGKVNLNIHAMAREGLRAALIGVIRKALRQDRPIRLNGLQVGTNGGTQIVDVVVQAIEQPEALRERVLVVFNDVAVPAAATKTRRRSAAAEHSALALELVHTREALQASQEEMQTSMEELKSSNEELQSTNEELQSANEELTTSKEEMQSLNEELQTVNAELQSKVDDLTWVRNDMTNLLNSTEIATVFLTSELKLRRFTPMATSLFKLIASDVGRPLSDLANDLDYPDLQVDTLEVLRTLVFTEKQISTHDGRWFRVRIMPYRTLDNVIDGAVITLMDITAIKRLEAELRRDADQAKPQD